MFSFTKKEHRNSSYKFFRRLAFQLNPEIAHELTILFSHYFPFFADIWGPPLDYSKFNLKIGSTTWPFPIGLAAGLDKNAECLDFFSRLPFGAVEVGTVTPRPQPGNPRPRLWRYVSEESLRNRMGFNNAGMEIMANHFSQVHCRQKKIIGINLGKNKDTPKEKAGEDYANLYHRLAPLADYIVINVSSPNTPGLRDLQKKEELTQIFEAMTNVRKNFNKDLYLKLSPDISSYDMEGAIELAHNYQLTGLIATNTTIMPERGEGGISGKLLKEKAKQVRNFILNRIKNTNLELIGVGGIDSFEDLWAFWKQGGKVAQIYSSFIFQGPPLLFDIAEKIEKILQQNQLKNLTQLLANIGHLDLPSGINNEK
ncbi:MAG: quinone-dependent dihydroorotate dehydrogenase [Pseudomonadota bacterium]